VPQAAAGNHSRLQGRAAMWVAASAICVSYILSTLPTPPYVIYRQTFQFSQIMLTVIYAVYVVGTVTTMFFLGRLSDQIGRRPVVLLSLGIAAAGRVIFICAQNIWWLFPARIFSGLGIALVSGAPRRGWWSWSRKTTTPPRLKWQSVQIFSGLAWDHFLPVCSANTR